MEKYKSNSFSSKLEEKAEQSLIDLDEIESVVSAHEQAEFYKIKRDMELAKLELREEQNGVSAPAKQRRNALASQEFKEYIDQEIQKFKKQKENLVKRENAKIIISAWQTSVKEKGVFV